MQPMRANELLAGLALADNQAITAVVTDSRAVVPGCVFVCFPGARVDGHDFAAAAYKAGAAYIVANHPLPGVPEERTVLVADSSLAMVRMAANYRMLFSPLMIGVTGSVGKTTTKDFCYAVLSAFGNTLKTEGNQNNDIGLPNTLFRLEPTTEYAVVEMGMSGPGEIERLVRAARPSAGIITNIGVAHLENLGTRENILKAKLEICAGLPDGAPLVLNADNDLLPTANLPARLRPVWVSVDKSDADVYTENVTANTGGTAFTLVDARYGRLPVRIPTVGMHTISDALAAYAAATRLGLDPARAAAALADYQPSGMRQHIVEHNGVTIIEDCYNASPDSMRAALNVLHALPNARHVALLGDMLELGAASAAAHRQVGEWAAESGVALLIACGPQSQAMAEAAAARGVTTLHCQTHQEVVKSLQECLMPGDALLVKASHAVGLEECLRQYYAAAAGEMGAG